MSIFGNIIGSGIEKPIEAVGNVFDELFTSDEERAKADFVMARLKQQPHILQAEINKMEAQHRSVFVAGWRPAVGWICAAALAWHFIIYDLLNWVAVVFEHPVPPELTGTEQLITVLLALLGLGGLRTFEKLNKVSK